MITSLTTRWSRSTITLLQWNILQPRILHSKSESWWLKQKCKSKTHLIYLPKSPIQWLDKLLLHVKSTMKASSSDVFSRGLDDNFEATWVADTNRSICWEGIEVDQYVSAAFCIKLKLQSMNKWASSSQKKDDNAATWKYGPSHPPPTSMDQPDRQPSTSYTHHWTSKKDLSPKEASILLTCYSCICCRKTVTP